MMRLFLALAACAATVALAGDPAYVQSVEAWRARAEASLRKDNGWLTLAGRYVLKRGVNTFGTGKDNDVVFPPGLGPARMGTISVEPRRVFVKLAPGLTMSQEGIDMTDKVMNTDFGERDWVSLGRASFYVLEHEGSYVLRLADNESQVRKRFGGRVWYPVDERFRVEARFVPYDPRHKVAIVNVIDEVSQEDVPGYVEFRLGAQAYRLDALDEDDGLFLVFRDTTAGKSTYPPGRFLFIDRKPAPGARVVLDFNRAYNPPCAFSEFTTCPLPPKQNILKVAIPAGEKYPPHKRAS